jgi:hypothetical protein
MSKGKKPLGGPRHLLKDDTEMYLQVTGWVIVWIVLVDDGI